MNLIFKRLTASAIEPAYATAGAAGLDLFADVPEPVVLGVEYRALIPTGIAIALPEGFEAQVRPRSGLALKRGVTVLNSPGTIDSDYRGQIGVILINLGYEPVTIEYGDRIAQLVIAPVQRAVLYETDGNLSDTARGAGGFGSTGSGAVPYRRPRCAIGGVLHGGRAMCGEVITGGEFCGYVGECPQKVAP